MTLMDKFVFDTMADGTPIEAYRLVNKNGASCVIMTYGGRVLELKMPDRNGNFGDVVLGFDRIASYQKDTSGQGALIGRFGNRIGGASYTLDGVTYNVAKNDNGVNHLHGGTVGYNARIWDAEPKGNNTLVLRLTDPDGYENYPGTVNVTVTYTLTDDNALSIHYNAITDKATIINLTNHSYFNLSDCTKGTVLDHQLQVDADYITPVDELLIPTGDLLAVAGTPFDFNVPKAIGRDIASGHVQMVRGNGYDHNFVLNGSGLRRVATLTAADTGRRMDVITDQPGVQIYSANFLTDETLPLCGNRPQEMRAAICLETQHFPDSPNKPQFPSVVLRPGEIYDTTTIYRFSTF
jgi:aldose 1-epimerase